MLELKLIAIVVIIVIVIKYAPWSCLNIPLDSVRDTFFEVPQSTGYRLRENITCLAPNDILFKQVIVYYTR